MKQVCIVYTTISDVVPPAREYQDDITLGDMELEAAYAIGDCLEKKLEILHKKDKEK